MPWLTNLDEVARRTGYPVVEQPGWQSRGHGPQPRVLGVVCHHTAGWNDMRVVRDGRPGLSGPLSQFWLSRTGEIHVIAAGRCWHNAPSTSNYHTNSNSLGIEAENDGHTAWPEVQLDAYRRLCAELCREFNLSASRVKGHKEVNAYKPDPHSIDMDRWRRDVAYIIKHGSGAAMGGDDVPDFRWYSAGGGQVIPPGEWTTVEWSNHQKNGHGRYWSIVFGSPGGTTYNLMASVTLDRAALPEGAKVQLRACHVVKEGGADLPDGVLRKGASGPKVRRVQEWLDDHGYNLGRWGADGKYGDTTEDAVRAFQRNAGISDDGVYGPQTEEAMEEKSGGAEWVIKHNFAPSTPATYSGDDDCDVSYSIPEKALHGKRARVRVRHNGDKPVRVTSANVYIHEWQ